MQWLEGLNKNILKFKNVILLPDTLSKELNLFFLYFTFYRRDGTFKKKLFTPLNQSLKLSMLMFNINITSKKEKFIPHRYCRHPYPHQ